MKASKVLFAALLMIAATGVVSAGHGHGDCGCPECGHKVCVFEPETTKVKKHCWEIEYKDVCIPKFKWPWECCCDPPSCGKVRTVKRLKKKEYECEKCGYKWTVQCVDDCCPQGDKCGPPVQQGAGIPYRSPNTIFSVPPPVRVADLP